MLLDIDIGRYICDRDVDSPIFGHRYSGTNQKWDGCETHPTLPNTLFEESDTKKPCSNTPPYITVLICPDCRRKYGREESDGIQSHVGFILDQMSVDGCRKLPAGWWPKNTRPDVYQDAFLFRKFIYYPSPGEEYNGAGLPEFPKGISIEERLTIISVFGDTGLPQEPTGPGLDAINSYCDKLLNALPKIRSLGIAYGYDAEANRPLMRDLFGKAIWVHMKVHSLWRKHNEEIIAHCNGDNGGPETWYLT
ncbi:hypothetical protein NHQ30_007147 [Ciborinia camelliae]|nr:hypothetical protein NHQ30_007147 [Ciborinia camelliae]